MAANLAAFNAMVDRKIQDTKPFLVGTDVDAFVEEAIRTYSKHRPQVIVEDETGDGGFDYQITGTAGTNLLADGPWEKGFSEIRRLVYPVDDTSQTETVIDEDDFAVITKIVSAAARDHIRFKAATPTATETFRVWYTARHVVNGGSTIPAADDEAVANLAAALCLDAIASRYLSVKNPSLDADVTDYQGRADQARRLADDYREAFERHMGIGDEGQDAQAAAGLIIDTDLPTQHRRGSLFHGARRR